MLDLQNGQCGTARAGEMHHEGGCLDATWGSVLDGLHPILSETCLATEGSLEALKHPVPHPIPQPPPRMVTLWTDASGENWGVLGEGGGHLSRISPPFTHNHTIMHIILKETLAAEGMS